MKRLLFLALWLPLAAFAQTTINVSVTYTPGAATRATNEGTTIAAKVNAQMALINAAYTSSGIGMALSANIVAAGNTAPGDSAAQAAQYAWVNNSPTAWQYRTNADASISVHISDTTGAGGVMQSGTLPGYARDSTMAVPYDYITTAMELAIGKIFGAGTGYANRARSFPTDPLAGQNYCYHTRESGPSNPSMVVPIPASFTTYYGAGYISQTQAVSKNTSCQAFRSYFISINGGGSTTYSSAAVVTNPGGDFCYMYDNHGVATFGGANAQIIGLSANPGGTITCDAEITFNSNYSKNGIMPGWPFLPLGDASHDSVTAMNARASTVAGFHGNNATLLGQKREGSFTPIWRFMKDLF